MTTILKKYGIFLIVLMFFVVTLFYLLYITVRKNFIKEIRNHAKYVAIFATTGVNPKDVMEIQGPEDIQKEAYKRLQSHLSNIQAVVADIGYIYIMRRSSANGAKISDYEYVVDLPSKDENMNGTIDPFEMSELPGNPYDASDLPALINAWYEPDADEDVSPDPPYPDLISGYAPIKTYTGETVGIIGIDVTASAIKRKLLTSRVVIIICGLIFSFFITAILFFYCGLKIAIDQIKAMNEELSEKNKRLADALELRKNLSHMIVHDIRNPLFTISGAIEILLFKNEDRNENTCKVYNRILGQTERINALLEDMLVLAKSEAGKLVLQTIPTNITELILQAKTQSETAAELADIKIMTDLPAESKEFELDPDLLIRVLDNLILNSIKFSPRSSKIVLSLEYPSSEESDSRARIKVIDEGVGVDPEMKKSIFEPFTTADRKPMGGKQIGLGLAFCKMVAEAHNGRIYIEDNHSRGSVFIVEI